MVDNPYESPSTLGSQPDAGLGVRKPSRPIGVAILAVLHFVAGVVFLGATFALTALHFYSPEEFLLTGVRFVAVVCVTLFAGLGVVSSVGMWRGAKWGWWLAAIYYALYILGTALELLVYVYKTFVSDSVLDIVFDPVEIIQHGVVTLVLFLLLLYWFRRTVLEFFGLKTISKLKAIAILTGTSVAIIGGLSAFFAVLIIANR